MGDLPRGNPAEANPVVLLLARLAAALEQREHEAVIRRRTIRPVEGGTSSPRKGGRAA